MTGQRTEYRARLLELEHTFVQLAAGLAAAIGPANRALLMGDRSAVGAARAAHSERSVACRVLEDECVVMLALEAPVSSDLRHVIAIIRALPDVERSSAMLTHAVGTLEEVDPADMIRPLRSALERLATSAMGIYRSGVRAWQERDGLAVNELTRLDREVDRSQADLLAALYANYPPDPLSAAVAPGTRPVEDSVAIALLGRYYERLADHGVALARHLTWALTGQRVEARPWLV